MASVRRAAGELKKLVTGEEWQPLLQPIHDALERAIAESDSPDDLRRRLAELPRDLDLSAINRRIAIAQFKARGLGGRDYRSEQ